MSGNFLDTTVEEWKAELEDHITRNDPGLTIAEIAAILGSSRQTAYRRVSELIKKGRCREGTGMRVNKSGRRQRVAVYLLLPKEN